jgi:polysaccharide pyruvyl transferase WcaK-like protein
VSSRLPAGGHDVAPRALRIALWGNFGTLNFGNECTLAAAIAGLRRQLPQATLTCVCPDPADVLARHGIAAVAMSNRGPLLPDGASKIVRLARRLCAELMDWWRVLRVVKGTRALVIAGTGILSDHGEGTLGFPYQLFKWCLVTRFAGGRVVFVSVGAESIGSRLGRFFLKTALRLAVYRSYRDTHSATLLSECGLRTDADPVFPDLAFGIDVPTGRTAAPRVTGKRPCVAVGLFNYRGRGGGDASAAAEYDAYLGKLCGLIGWLSTEERGVRVFIGDLAYDAAVSEDLRARLGRREPGTAVAPGVLDDMPPVSWEQLLTQLAAVDYVIASRYHNVLLAVLLGKPTISVSYEAKNEALMQQVGLRDYCQTLDGLDLERLKTQFLEMERNADVLRSLMAAQVRANREHLEEQYRLVVAELSEK